MDFLLLQYFKTLFEWVLELGSKGRKHGQVERKWRGKPETWVHSLFHTFPYSFNTHKAAVVCRALCQRQGVNRMLSIRGAHILAGKEWMMSSDPSGFWVV